MSRIKASPELCAIVERWFKAYAEGDKDTVVNLFAPDPSLSYIGSADNEIWRGPDLPRTLAAYMDDIPRFSFLETDVRGFACGDLGWVEWHSLTTADTGKTVRYRSTFVLALEKGLWRIVTVHNSNPVSNMQAMGYEARGFEELLAAARTIDFAHSGIATIMFTDIADSTTLAETIGDARWSDAVTAHVVEVEKIITDHGGTLVKSLGDGTMSSFPSARAALSAAIALQQAMAASDSEPRLQIRVGLHTGDLIEQQGDIFGTVVNKAARIAALAAPGEIWLADATRIMVGGATPFTFSEPASVPLKGLEGEHVIHRLEWRQ